MRKDKTQNGLSLIEVMVALTILAGVAVSIIVLVSQNTRFISNSEQRLIATIEADNELIRDLLTDRFLEEGDVREEIVRAQSNWVVRKTTVNAGEGLFRIKIDVSIAGSEQVLSSVETLKAQAQ